jgi:two-component system sensor histidine kinase FlrB
VLDALPAGVVVLNGLGVVEGCNPAARSLFGADPTGTLWREVVAQRFRPRPDDGPDLSLADGRRVRVATGALDPLPGQVLLLQDVTATRALQDRLGQLERLSALGEMAARVAHQIRTPLASAILYAGALARPAADGPETGRFAGRLMQVLRQLEALVRDMLLFARQGSFEVEEVSLGELFEALRAQVAGRRASAGARVDLPEAGDGVRLRCSRQALAGALANLVDNAWEAGADTVTVSLGRAAPTRLRIEVRDNGPGVPEAAAEKVFLPFFTTRPSGSGLGLAVVRAVVEAHGGSVALVSREGEGACFRVELPTLERPGRPLAAGAGGPR